MPRFSMGAGGVGGGSSGDGGGGGEEVCECQTPLDGKTWGSTLWVSVSGPEALISMQA